MNNLYSLLSVIENTSNDRERAVDRITRVSLWIGMAVVVTTSNINTQSADSITGDRGQPSRPPIDRCPPNPKYNAVKISSLSSVLIWKWYLNYLIMIIFLTYDIKLFASKDVLNRPFFRQHWIYGPTIDITKKKVMKLCNFVKTGSAAIKPPMMNRKNMHFLQKRTPDIG